MNIMYFVFGNNITNHNMVYYSVLTFLAKSAKTSNRVFVLTDTPELYNHLKDYVSVINITAQQIEEWKGKHKFFWRAKIKAIEYVANLAPDAPLVYLDGDTFFYGDIMEMNTKLNAGQGMMHLDEGHPSNMKTKSLSMWKTVGNKTYSGVKITKTHNMWNAGVVAIPQQSLNKTISLALALCDGFLDDGAEPIVVEQYSLSIALQETTGLTPADKYIAHYWGNKKEWNDIISSFLLRSHMQGLTVKDEIKAVESIDNISIPIYIHYSHWADIINKWVKKNFQPKIVRYAQ